MCRFTLRALGLSMLILGLHTAGSATRYAQLNLVSDIAGLARYTDSNLVNPWGLVANPINNSIQVANNGTGTSTAYDKNGNPFPSSSDPVVFNIPGPGGVGEGTPSGVALNRGDGFMITKNGNSFPAIYIFATEDGTIAGWNPLVDPNNAVLVVDNSASNAVYKGVAIASHHGHWRLYVTDFYNGLVNVYNANFEFLFSFTDASTGPGFAPFGIRNINNFLYVTFAKQDSDRHDDVPGPGNGFVDAFYTDGGFARRVISHHGLNSPWGLIVAPQNFGDLAGHLLVGNFGDGTIQAYELFSGRHVRALKNIQGDDLVISGLWGLEHGNTNEEATTIYFTAGPGCEGHGLFGKIRPLGNLPGDDESGEDGGSDGSDESGDDQCGGGADQSGDDTDQSGDDTDQSGDTSQEQR